MDMARFFEIPGVGGAIAALVIATLVTSYYLTLKWVVKGQEDNTDDN
jgi:hypothetical protein